MIFSLSFSISFCSLFQEIPQFYILILLWIIYFCYYIFNFPELLSSNCSFFGASCLCFMDAVSYNYLSEDSYCLFKIYSSDLYIVSAILWVSPFLFHFYLMLSFLVKFISTIWWSFSVPSNLRMSHYKCIWKVCVDRKSLSVGGLYCRMIRWGPICFVKLQYL